MSTERTWQDERVDLLMWWSRVGSYLEWHKVRACIERGDHEGAEAKAARSDRKEAKERVVQAREQLESAETVLKMMLDSDHDGVTE